MVNSHEKFTKDYRVLVRNEASGESEARLLLRLSEANRGDCLTKMIVARGRFPAAALAHSNIRQPSKAASTVL